MGWESGTRSLLGQTQWVGDGEGMGQGPLEFWKIPFLDLGGGSWEVSGVFPS